jgi:probable rRNA maturation factor
VLKDQLSAESIINVHIIGHTRMQTLNTLYRGISAPTDVLSFETGENWSGEGSQELGDIFICQPYIITQANRFGVTPREEMIRMLVHGTLHLLGYDHEKQKDATRMFALQESYVETCRIVTK